MKAMDFLEVLKVMNCLTIVDFNNCFEKDSEYLWVKFVTDKNSDVFSFICYLDHSNLTKYYDYCISKEV